MKLKKQESLDDKIINILKRIKSFCTNMSDIDCVNCRFNHGCHCEIAQLIELLQGIPDSWDMNYIEQMIRGEDKTNDKKVC